MTTLSCVFLLLIVFTAIMIFVEEYGWAVVGFIFTVVLAILVIVSTLCS